MPENLRYDLAWHMMLLQGHGHGVSCHVAREPESIESDSEPEVVEISAEMLVASSDMAVESLAAVSRY